MRVKARDDSEESGLAAGGWTDDGDQLADVRQVFDHKRDVLNRDFCVRAMPKDFGDILKYHNVGAGARSQAWRGLTQQPGRRVRISELVSRRGGLAEFFRD